MQNNSPFWRECVWTLSMVVDVDVKPYIDRKNNAPDLTKRVHRSV